MSDYIKVQLPIQSKLKKIGEKLASKEGLSSYQELLRYWTVQASKGNLYISNLPSISDMKINTYNKETNSTINKFRKKKIKSYKDAESLINSLEE